MDQVKSNIRISVIDSGKLLNNQDISQLYISNINKSPFPQYPVTTRGSFLLDK